MYLIRAPLAFTFFIPTVHHFSIREEASALPSLPSHCHTCQHCAVCRVQRVCMASKKRWMRSASPVGKVGRVGKVALQSPDRMLPSWLLTSHRGLGYLLLQSTIIHTPEKWILKSASGPLLFTNWR